jgi:hypothetical protein
MKFVDILISMHVYTIQYMFSKPIKYSTKSTETTLSDLVY